MMEHFSLVVPVYKNEGTILALLEVLADLYAKLDRQLEVVFVVDGSPDRCYEILRSELPGQPFASQLIRLSRNFGSFAAIRTGMLLAHGPYYGVMAADLQEPPELVIEFFRALKSKDYDIAMGIRTHRNDPVVGHYLSRLFWTIYCKFVQPEMPTGGFDVFGCNRQVRDLFVELKEANSSLVGLLVWVGFRKKLIPYERRARPSGKSAWTLRKKFSYMLDSMYAFTALPVMLLFGVGLIGIVFSFLFGLLAVAVKIWGKTDVPGYTALVVIILFCTSLILFGLGIIGGYVWRTFENTKARPQFVVMSNESFVSGKSQENS